MSGLTHVTPPCLSDRFVVVDKLGQGGTAEIFLAFDLRLKRWCALKSMLRKYSSDDTMRKRFCLEAETMAKLSHDNIPNLMAWEPDHFPPYLVMSLARCGSVMDWVRANGPMPLSLATDILFQICEALHTCHEAGVVHRDIKPHNFLLDEESRVWLTDFGIAQVDDTEVSITLTGSQVGTFAFMAPEQRAKGDVQIDHRADVFGLGSSLYAMITGTTSSELFIAAREPKILAPVHQEFHEILIKACSYKPADRYDSVRDLQLALMNSLSVLPSDQGGYPPLVESVSTLPDRPPTSVPMERLGELVNGGEPPKATPPPAPAVREVLPYSMPEATGEHPSYLDPESLYEQQDREDLSEEAQPAIVSPPDLQGDKPAVHRTALVALGGALGLLLVVIGLVGFSFQTAAGARDKVVQGRGQLRKDIATAQAAVVDLPPPMQSQFRTMLDEMRQGQLVDDALAVALQNIPPDSAPDAKARLKAVVDQGSVLNAAVKRWEDVSTGFPGSLAVNLGLVELPRQNEP